MTSMNLIKRQIRFNSAVNIFLRYVTARFSHCNLPYLFGFCTKNKSIVMSYHGIDNHTVSLHDVLYPSKSRYTSRDWCK